MGRAWTGEEQGGGRESHNRDARTETTRMDYVLVLVTTFFSLKWLTGATHTHTLPKKKILAEISFFTNEVTSPLFHSFSLTLTLC